MIFLGAIHLFRYYFANHFSLRYTIQEMPMRHSKILKDAYEQSIVIKKSYVNEWVWSLSIAHCESVKTYKFIYIHIILIDIHWVSFKFSEDSYLKDTIIVVCKSKYITWIMLLNLFTFNKIASISTNFFFECLSIGFKAILSDVIRLLILHGQDQCSFRICWDNHWDDWVFCVNHSLF